MIELLFILIGFVIAYEVESGHDKILSELKQTKEQGKKWHRLDAIFNIIIAFIVGYLYNGISLESGLFLLYIASLRITYFPIRLNMKRDKPLFYLSKTNDWDKHFVGNKVLYFIVAFILLLGSMALLIRTHV